MSLFSKKKTTSTPKGWSSDQSVGEAKKKDVETPKVVVDKKNEESPRIASRLIIKPLLTEKATRLEEYRQYVFVIDSRANKSEIKKEVERLFDVSVEKVNIINRKRKKRMWKRIEGFSPGLKKAIVTVGKDDKIEVLPH